MYGGGKVLPGLVSRREAAAAQRNIEVVALRTPEICAKLRSLRPEEINAVLHVTC